MENYTIRQEARELLTPLSGKLLLFLIPIIYHIINIVVEFRNTYNEVTIGSNTNQLNVMLSGNIFRLASQFLLGLVLIGVLWTVLEVVRGKRTSVSIDNSLRVFRHPQFGKILATSLFKALFLFLWGLPLAIGTFLLLSGFAIYTLGGFSQGVVQVDYSMSEIGLVFMIIGMLLSIAGCVPLIIKSYSYAMTSYILYDDLENNTYTAATDCITASRKMMNGYKFQLFLLHFSFIGWWILTALTAGLLSIYVLPYYYTSEVIFYDKLNRYLKR